MTTSQPNPEDDDSTPLVVRWMLLLGFAAAGLWIEAVALGFVPNTAPDVVPRWVLALFGMVFFGFAMRPMADRRVAGIPAGRFAELMIIFAITVVVHWVALGPGTRHFFHSRNGSLQIGPSDSSAAVIAGRAGLALIALLLDFLIVRACIRWWRLRRASSSR